MYFDIGGWWLSCDHMFRRFGTPFAVDWLAKNVNGYLYTAAVPADPDVVVSSQEYGNRYWARTPADDGYPAAMADYLDAVLPVYGEHFVTWWNERLVPEMQRNFTYLEEALDRADRLSLAELAVLLEDAIDMHDRHWKIHWMLNFAQLSATLRLREVMGRVRGTVDEELLGRLQNSAADRNWDSVEGLWSMKEEVKASEELGAAFAAGEGSKILAALRSTEAGNRFVEERLEPYQREFGWRAVWSHEFVFPTFREQPEPILEQVRDYLRSDYDYPAAVRAVRDTIDSACTELLDGLTGPDRDELAAANEVNLRMAPLTPDHHFYIDQGANARVRLVLMAVGARLVADGVLDQPDDVMYLRYRELRGLVGRAVAGSAGGETEVRGLVATRRAERAAAADVRPRDWVGTVTRSQLDFPYWVNWGYPDRFYRTESADGSTLTGIAGSPGSVEGIARVVRDVNDFDDVTDGDILVCQMTNPAWVVLFTKIAGLVTDTGGTTSHPAVLAREFEIPAVVGTSEATRWISTGDRIRVDGSAGTVEVLSRDQHDVGPAPSVD
jgi:pyruvate,water dikinase